MRPLSEEYLNGVGAYTGPKAAVARAFQEGLTSQLKGVILRSNQEATRPERTIDQILMTESTEVSFDGKEEF